MRTSGASVPFPEAAVDGPVVLLIDETSCSDAVSARPRHSALTSFHLHQNPPLVEMGSGCSQPAGALRPELHPTPPARLLG